MNHAKICNENGPEQSHNPNNIQSVIANSSRMTESVMQRADGSLLVSRMAIRAVWWSGSIIVQNIRQQFGVFQSFCPKTKMLCCEMRLGTVGGARRQDSL